MCALGWIGVTESHQQWHHSNAHTTSYSMRLSCTVYRVRDIANYLLKVANFNLPDLHLDLNFNKIFGMG